MKEIEEKHPDFFVRGGTGTEEYQHLQSTLEAINNFGKKKPSKEITKEVRQKRLAEGIERIEYWRKFRF